MILSATLTSVRLDPLAPRRRFVWVGVAVHTCGVRDGVAALGHPAR